MQYIDRYLNEVGRFLSRKNRADILAEIRSYISDKLDERSQGEPTEEDVLAVLNELGDPQKLAYSYDEGNQYLIGRELYPFFNMVVRIVLAAVIGAQLLALGIGVWSGEVAIQPLEAVAEMISSVLSAIGSVVVVFMILQRFGVNPKLEDKPWDPRDLPVMDDAMEVKKGEAIFGIAGGSVLLALLAILPKKIGVYSFPEGAFYTNPVISQYLGLICLSLLAGIGLEIYLLWQGRWSKFSRAAELVINFFSVVVLALLVKGHTQWLIAHGTNGFFLSIENLGKDLNNNIQMFGMEVFRMAFGVALVVTTIEIIVNLVKMIRNSLRDHQKPEFISGK